MISKRLIKIDAFLNYISISLEFSRINPSNVRAEYRKFRKKIQNPAFRYEPADEYLDIMLGVLKEIKLGGNPVEKLLDRKRRDLLKKIRFLLSIGTEDMTRRSKILYSYPNDDLVKRAYRLLKLPKGPKQRRIKRQETKAMLRQAFKTLGFKWRLLNRDMVTSARVNPIKQTLELRKKERFSEKFVRRLIVHEIGVHALRAENGREQPLKTFLHGLANYLETEEGLAVYAEHLTGLLDNTTLRNYAGRVVAIHYALSHSFVATYKHMKRFFTEKTAWRLTLRAKRGLCDTSRPGAYTKDAIYLRGFFKVKNYIETGGDIENLFVGKVGLGDLPIIENIPEINPPRYLPFELFANEFITPGVRLPETLRERRIKKEIHDA
ncbi:MAG: tyrosine/phenylalanine carboxypeptidase domain-containing protein [Nanoarchaeota archaeon]